MNRTRSPLLLAMLILALATLVAIVARPMTPIDETRYISVAWEMWLRGDWLVPFKNGEPYSHKPPLMMWLYQLGWLVFGVSEWWARLVSPLFSVGCLLLTVALARRLWPGDKDLGERAALVLASSLLWIFFSTAAMFDVMLAFFTLAGMHGILRATEGGRAAGFALLGLAIGLGVLAKGPVILLHTLPVALLAPWWQPGLPWKRWYAGIAGAVLLGATIALAWAIPAGIAGGEDYQRAIFWGQTAHRVVQSFAHKRAIWWYLPLLPVMFFPWLLIPGVWRGLRDLIRGRLDRGTRLCIAWLLPVFLTFSLISGKQMHYLIPLFPAFALLVARIVPADTRGGVWLPAIVAIALAAALALLAVGRLPVARNPLPELPLLWPALLLLMLAIVLGWRRRPTFTAAALLGAATVALLQLSLLRSFHTDYDTKPLAEAIAAAQAEGRQVAHDGFYHDQFHFAGRLRAPLVAFEDEREMTSWLEQNPEARAVVYLKHERQLQGYSPLAAHGYLGGVAALLAAPEAAALLRGK